MTVPNLETSRLSIVEINSSNRAKDHTFKNGQERLSAKLLQLPMPQNWCLAEDYDGVTRQMHLNISVHAHACHEQRSWIVDLLYRRQRLMAASRASWGSWKCPNRCHIFRQLLGNFWMRFSPDDSSGDPLPKGRKKPKSVNLAKSTLHSCLNFSFIKFSSWGPNLHGHKTKL